jgi:hypothetical protein
MFPEMVAVCYAPFATAARAKPITLVLRFPQPFNYPQVFTESA